MRLIRAALAGAVILGCSSSTTPNDNASSSSSGGTRGNPNAEVFCKAYQAQCPAKVTNDDVAKCLAQCTTEESLHSDKCYFPACGVEVRKCDNEDDGDPSIIACATTHGWRSPSSGGGGTPKAEEFCKAYQAQCPAKVSGNDLAKCLAQCTTEESLHSDKCYFPACGVEVHKCDNEEDGDPSIIACANAHGWRQ